MNRLFYGGLADLHTSLRLAAAPDSVLSPEYKANLYGQIMQPGTVQTVIDLDLKASKASLERLANALSRPEFGDDAIRHFASQLDDRLVDELQETLLLALSAQAAKRLGLDLPFGQSVADAFPSSSVDIEEATKCLALDRGTASVFHSMRVMEVGLKALGTRLAVPATYKPGWEGILKKAHGQMTLPNDKKEPDWIKDEAFLSEAIALLTAVKTAWRNPTMHVEKTYTPEQAERIWTAARSFMQHLAEGGLRD